MTSTKKISHHLDEATILAFSAGTLGEALSVVAASHIAMCETCRKAVRMAERVGAGLFDREFAEPVCEGGFEKLLKRTEAPMADAAAGQGRSLPPHARKSELPRALARYFDQPLDEIRWTKIAPGVRLFELPVMSRNGGKLRLFNVAAGRALPEHGHHGDELTLVLRGAYSDRYGRFGSGDIADLGPDAEHKPIVDDNAGCICVIATDAPMRYKTLMGRVLQPVIGI